MTLEEYTPEKILEDVERLQYLYGLKRVTRYDLPRAETDNTESVAEHLYGMQLLAIYFLPLEDPFNKLNWTRVLQLITIHDFDEIETGDYVSYIKTEVHHAEARLALPKVLAQVPQHINGFITDLSAEYETQSSDEAKFVKAIDKIEPLLQIYNEQGKEILHKNKCTASDSLTVKAPYIENFPFIKKLGYVIHEKLIAGGYYWQEHT